MHQKKHRYGRMTLLFVGLLITSFQSGPAAMAQNEPSGAFNGLGMNLGNLSRLSKAKTRSISAENPTGEKGKGAMAAEGVAAASELGQGWKVSPYVNIEPGKTVTLADIQGPGAIQSMWIGGYVGRDYILRIQWEDQEQPSVECPLPDFFALPWVTNDQTPGTRGPLVQIDSLPVAVNPNKGLNCFWEMPFRKRCRITIQNLHPRDTRQCYYQINYTLTEVPQDCAYFHAQFPPRQSRAVQRGLYDPGRREGPRALRRHVDGCRREQQPLVGRGRDQVLPRWRH